MYENDKLVMVVILPAIWDQSILGEHVAGVGQFLRTVLTVENTSIYAH